MMQALAEQPLVEQEWLLVLCWTLTWKNHGEVPAQTRKLPGWHWGHLLSLNLPQLIGLIWGQKEGPCTPTSAPWRKSGIKWEIQMLHHSEYMLLALSIACFLLLPSLRSGSESISPGLPAFFNLNLLPDFNTSLVSSSYNLPAWNIISDCEYILLSARLDASGIFWHRSSPVCAGKIPHVLIRWRVESHHHC